jgi:predicted amidohydrolase YtcJ
MKRLQLLLIVFLPLLVTAQEKIFYNARIFTANSRHPFAEAIAIKDKRVIAVGNYSEVIRSVSTKAELIDCNGGFLMPGFVDSHNHGISGGRGLTKANVSDQLMTIDELVTYAKRELEKKDGMTGDVLVIFGINISTWSQLDIIIQKFNADVFLSQPIVLRGSDGHTSWANNAMMKRAGLDKKYIQSLKPEEKIFFGTTKNDEPNGFVSESGYQKISSVLTVETDFSNAAEKTMEYNNSYGITAWLDPTVSSVNNSRSGYLDWYKDLIDHKKLTAHIAGCVVADADGDPQKQITN